MVLTRRLVAGQLEPADLYATVFVVVIVVYVVVARQSLARRVRHRSEVAQLASLLEV